MFDRSSHSPVPANAGMVATLCFLLFLGAAPSWGKGPPSLEPPAVELLGEARALVERMKASERGPYSRIRWTCKDGSVLPPTPYACRDHGGGRQHAEYSDDRARLAALGWPVGTIFAALSWEEFWDGDQRNQRLRALPVERYLTEIDDGWVLRRARYYRGRVQAEDEDAAGRDLLVALLSRGDWTTENFFLTREAVRWVPHGGTEDHTRTIRALAQDLADREASFGALRAKLHTSPDPGDGARVRAWEEEMRKRGAPTEVLRVAGELTAALEQLFGEQGRRERLREAGRAVSRLPRGTKLAGLLASASAGDARRKVRDLAAVLSLIREAALPHAFGAGALAFLDLSLAVEEELLLAGLETLQGDPLSRADLLRFSRDLVDAVYGCGFVSVAERLALAVALDRGGEGDLVPSDRYLEATRALRRVGPWAVGTVRFSFAEALVRFAALEPKATAFVDDRVRASPLLPLAEATRRLTLDAEFLSGIAHRVFGATPSGVLGLNPGLAVGRLRVVREEDLSGHVRLGRDEVVVLPRTVSELDPVAGILTLAEGNLLSHVQLLARNLGIPNVSLAPGLAGAVRARDGQRVVLAVGGDGSVALEAWEDLPPETRALLESGQRPPGEPGAKVEPPAPNLAVRQPLPLAELHAGLSGRVVGPKAANLGELARLFPGRVAQAVALPFGIFAAHAEGPRERLREAYARARRGELDAAALEAEVEAVWEAVRALEPSAELRTALTPLMERLFGPPGSYGVFVRSDTNVEDLPGFTGAGLNETVPHVVGLEQQLATLSRVWASPFTRRAMAWREQLLTRPEEVYPSVLLMKSVPSEKSGVLVTADVIRRGPGLTVAVAWGLGGAVDNEAAETLLLAEDGAVERVTGARAPYRRRLRPEGGLEWVPAPLGEVLTAEERKELRRLAAEVGERIEPQRGPDGRPLPWDVEFGFVAGHLQLFQIRPLVERGQGLADRVVALLRPQGRGGRATVSLAEAPWTGEEGGR